MQTLFDLAEYEKPEPETIRVIRLDLHWTECGVCDTDIPLVDSGYSLSMYEGEVVNPDIHEGAGFPVCEKCYKKGKCR